MKILFLQEYLRENHVKKQPDGTIKNIFLQTKAGGILKNLIKEGLSLDSKDFVVEYAYGIIPKVLQRNKGQAVKYKTPTLKEASEEYPYLYKRIVEEKPDIIIPTGNLGCKALLGSASISKARGVPQRATIEYTPPDTPNEVIQEINTDNITQRIERLEEQRQFFLEAYRDRMDGSNSLKKEYRDIENAILSARNQLNQQTGTSTHTCWVLPMYSIEYMLINPNIQNLIEADFVTLKKYIDQGDSAFDAAPVEYEHVENIERVREIFLKEVKEAPVVAWDLETNTLRAESIGAKPLVISLSWKEGEGTTIPLEHKEFQWKPEELEEIYGYIKDFVADPNIVKVAHNGQFDQRFLRLTKGFTEFNNHRDTKVMYYLLVNQSVDNSLRLSDLAYELTDMGGYDKALDDYKKEYIKDYFEKEKVRIAELKKEEMKKYKAMVKYQKDLAKAEGRTYEAPPKPEFPKAGKPINEVDGSDFNYEWIPLKEMLSPYASGDVDCCLRIHNVLDAVGLKPENERIRKLYTEDYTRMLSALAAIEANGVKVDVDYVHTLIEAYTAEEERLVEEMRKFPDVQRLEAELLKLYELGLSEWAKPKAIRDEEVAKLRDKYKDGKHIFNPNSSEHKQKVLFKYTGVRPPFNKEYIVDKAMEDGIPEDQIEWYHYKTNKATIEYLSKNNPEVAELAKLLLTHSLVKTRKQNFTYKLLKMVGPDGRIRGSFNPTGTETSRLSSNNPNLQQIPRKTGDVTRFDYKYPIKRMFVTSFENGALIQMDYSALESRVLALAAYDEQMIQAFLDGKDVHKDTASLVNRCSIEDVTDDMRSEAKAVSFGLAYGI